MEQLYDLTIIGGGPAGLYSTFYAGVRQLKVKCIEAAPSLGGRLLLYPNYTISDVGGQLPILCQHFTNNLIEQAYTFKPTFCLNERVLTVEEQNEQFIIHTSKGQHYSKTVLFATGTGYFEPKKLAAFPLSPQLEPFYTYNITQYERFYEQDVLLYGNSNVTAEWALQVKPYAKSVTLMTSEKRWAIGQELLQELTKQQIKTYNNVRYKDGVIIDGKVHCDFGTMQLQFDCIVIQPGYHRRPMNESLQLAELLPSGIFEGNVTGCTTHPKIFAAGDCLDYDGKLNFLVGAFHDAMNAVNYAAHAVDEKKHVSTIVSTHHPVFRKI